MTSAGSKAERLTTGRVRSGALDPDAHVLSEVEDGKGLPLGWTWTVPIETYFRAVMIL